MDPVETPAIPVETESAETTTQALMGDTGSTVVELSSIVPVEYADKPWIKDVSDIQGLFKMTDDMKSELGKRPAGIPQDNATDEQMATFNKAFGVPENVEGYELAPAVEGMEDFQKGVRDIMLKAGVSQKQAAALDAGYNELVKGLQEAAGGNSELKDADFDELAKKTFGDREEVAMATAKALLAENTPEHLKEHVDNLSNENLMILAAVLDKFQAKYIAEDDLPVPKPATTVAEDGDRLSAIGRSLMSDPAWANTSDSRHKEIAAKVAENYEKLRKLG